MAAQNQDFIREENRRRVEEMLSGAAELARMNGIGLDEMKRTLELFYEEDE